MRYRLRFLWAAIFAVVLFCAAGIPAAAQDGFGDFSGARIGPGFSFRTGEPLTVAQLPFNLYTHTTPTLTAQLSADILGVVPKLIDISEARIAGGLGLHLANPENKRLSGGLGYEFEKFGLCIYMNWKF